MNVLKTTELHSFKRWINSVWNINCIPIFKNSHNEKKGEATTVFKNVNVLGCLGSSVGWALDSWFQVRSWSQGHGIKPCVTTGCGSSLLGILSPFHSAPPQLANVCAISQKKKKKKKIYTYIYIKTYREIETKNKKQSKWGKMLTLSESESGVCKIFNTILIFATIL